MNKIMQINVTANIGSTGRIAEQIGLKILDCNWESYILYGRSSYMSKSLSFKIGNKLDFYKHALYSLCFDGHGLGSKGSTRDLINYIDRNKPDLIHLHNIHGYYINYDLLFRYLYKIDIPVVWTLHDCWPFTGHCAYFSLIDCKKWINGCYNCKQIKSYPKSFFIDRSEDNWLLKKSLFSGISNLTIVPVSNWLSQLVASSFLNIYPSKVIRNGIDINQFTIDESNHIRERYLLNSKIILLGVAHDWSARKGLDDFLALDKIIDHSRFQIILIGLSTKQLSKLPKTIIGLTKTKSISELSKFYSDADLFLNFTYEDNYPTTNLEAYACGTRVLTYDTGGSIESINPDLGFIIQQGDLYSVKLIIDKLKISDKKFYSPLCRNYAIDNFNQDLVFNSYIELYQTVLKQSSI